MHSSVNVFLFVHLLIYRLTCVQLYFFVTCFERIYRTIVGKKLIVFLRQEIVIIFIFVACEEITH